MSAREGRRRRPRRGRVPCRHQGHAAVPGIQQSLAWWGETPHEATPRRRAAHIGKPLRAAASGGAGLVEHEVGEIGHHRRRAQNPDAAHPRRGRRLYERALDRFLEEHGRLARRTAEVGIEPLVSSGQVRMKAARLRPVSDRNGRPAVDTRVEADSADPPSKSVMPRRQRSMWTCRAFARAAA